MRGAKTGLLVLVLLVALSGCAAMDFTKSLFVTGVSLEVLGDQFVQTSQQVTVGCASESIPGDLCRKYRVFGENFKRVYPPLVGMWKAAATAGDKATQGKAEDVARSLAVDLATISAEILASFAQGSK